MALAKWCETLLLLMKFLANIVKEKLWMHNRRLPLSRPPPIETTELESSSPPTNIPAAAPAARGSIQANDGSIVGDQTITLWTEWSLVVIGVCFAAIGAALQALQITGPLPLKSQLVNVALIVFFTAVMVSIYLRSNYKRASDVLLHVGFLFGTSALVAALSINLQAPLMMTSLAIFFSGIFIVVIARLSKPTT